MGAAGPVFAQQPVADCEKWYAVSQSPRRAIALSATATLEQLQNGVFVGVDVSHASKWSESGGEVLLTAPWSFTLGTSSVAETYRVRLTYATYHHAVTEPSSAALASWPASQIHRASAASAEFTCQSNRPALSLTAPVTISRGQGSTFQANLSLAASWTSPLQFVLASGPRGMSIDAATGEISWTPTASDIGRRAFLVALESEGQIIDIAGAEISVSEH